MSKKSVDNNLKIWYITNALVKRPCKNDLWKLSKMSKIWVARLNLNNNLFFMRVWSWLRMNAGGMPKTCKSYEAAQWFISKHCELAQSVER